MGWAGDLLREIPLSVIQQQKIAEVEEKYAALEADNASLKDDLRNAKAEITKLKGSSMNSSKNRPNFPILKLSYSSNSRCVDANTMSKDFQTILKKMLLALNTT